MLFRSLIRKRSYLTLLLDKNGLVGGLLFGIGLYMGFGFVGSGYRQFPQTSWVGPVVTVCLILLFARGFLSISNRWSSGHLTCLCNGVSHLEGGFPLRCLQRLSRPNMATRRMLLAEQPVH